MNYLKLHNLCHVFSHRVVTDDFALLEFRQSVQRYFSDESFSPSELLVTTWDSVGYYDAQTDKVVE